MHSAAPEATVTSTPDRSALFSRIRAELREHHRRLTDGQIDLIANVAVELRLTKVRLGFDSLLASS